MFDVLRAYSTLLRYLGPWSAPTARPTSVERRAITVAPEAAGDRAFEAWVYTPAGRAPIGAYLVCPGLHYAGPADPRLDRFCAILAAAGLLVLAPFLPDFTALRVDPRVVSDLDRAFAALTALPELPRGVKPGIFSISFGSLPALRVAASEKRRDQVGAAVIFGGYADWSATIRFCLGQSGNRNRDPLNQPVVLMNLIDDLPNRPGDPQPVLQAWRRYVEATWGRPEMKAPELWKPVAEELARTLAPDDASLFRIGVGLDEGALALSEAALTRPGRENGFLDPRPYLSGLTCPVVLCHGADDDVIPSSELAALAAAIPKTVRLRTYLTGLYHHTGTSSLGALFGSAGALLREGWALIGILRAIVGSARTRTSNF